MAREPGAESANAGCLLAVAGGVAALLTGAPRASFSLNGGFEGHARDLTVPFVQLPLIVLGAALLPLAVGALTRRHTTRAWLPVAVSLTALALGLAGVTAWWTPRQEPDPGYGPGI
ncbi:hypothetical protein [Streptomyces avicenniae]|uniref:hypothetical protein n=1 Tax=Streptomyces avicenniae TaxID=500153 RepID=UPI000699CCAC|nr:hypothetical protein [Streptomyces avicenniae]